MGKPKKVKLTEAEVRQAALDEVMASGGQRSPSSLRTYRLHRGYWEQFCRGAGIRKDVRDRPTAAAVVRWIQHLNAEGYAASTIRHYVGGLRQITRIEPADPGREAADFLTRDVADVLRVLGRAEHHRNRPRQQAPPCRAPQMAAVADAAEVCGPAELMALAGYELLLRADEGERFRWAQFDLAGRQASITSSKTDQFARGALLPISEPLCGLVAALLPASGKVCPSYRITVPDLVRAANGSPGSVRADGRPQRYTSHSLRRGRAQDMAAAGESVHAIMVRGRWSSLGILQRYLGVVGPTPVDEYAEVYLPAAARLLARTIAAA